MNSRHTVTKLVKASSSVKGSWAKTWTAANGKESRKRQTPRPGIVLAERNATAAGQGEPQPRKRREEEDREKSGIDSAGGRDEEVHVPAKETKRSDSPLGTRRRRKTARTLHRKKETRILSWRLAEEHEPWVVGAPRSREQQCVSALGQSRMLSCAYGVMECCKPPSPVWG